MDKERIQKFWEKCGFNSFPSQEQRYVSYPSRSLHSRYKTRDVLEYVPVTKWIYPDGGTLSSLPPIDLNNLVKYAVPKLEQVDNELRQISFTYNYSQTITCEITRENDFIYAVDKDPATALFLAIEKALKEQIRKLEE